MLTAISALAQLESDQLAERTRAGMAADEHARMTRPRKITTGNAKVERDRNLKTQGPTPTDVGEVIGASRATVYRYLRVESNEVI